MAEKILEGSQHWGHVQLPVNYLLANLMFTLLIQYSPNSNKLSYPTTSKIPTHNLYWGIIPVNCSSIHVGRYQNRFRAPKDEKKFRGYRQVYVGRQSSRVTKMGYNPDASQYQIYLVDESKGQVIG